jgi:hypothetical protein
MQMTLQACTPFGRYVNLSMKPWNEETDFHKYCIDMIKQSSLASMTLSFGHFLSF